MSKLHYCLNGTSVTDQVLKFQKSNNSLDYDQVKKYYDEYKEHWYSQISDYMDRTTFDSEFDFKLCRAVESFKIETADSIAASKGYTRLGAFNGWFYKILSNWKSNVKTSTFRLKKRPPVQCPVCGRYVTRIDSEHLEHFRSISDLPKYFVHDNEIFETSAVPRMNAISWGEKTQAKWRDLQRARIKDYTSEKKRVSWPWYLPNGKKGVMCPFTKNIIPAITIEYLRGLANSYSRYAEPMSWEVFVEKYPSSLIQSEIYSLDQSMKEDGGKKMVLRDRISKHISQSGGFDYTQMCDGKIPAEFEHVFFTIEKMVSNAIDRDILKLIAVGYSIEDISDTLGIDRKEVRRRMRLVRDSNDEIVDLLIG